MEIRLEGARVTAFDNVVVDEPLTSQKSLPSPMLHALNAFPKHGVSCTKPSSRHTGAVNSSSKLFTQSKRVISVRPASSSNRAFLDRRIIASAAQLVPALHRNAKNVHTSPTIELAATAKTDVPDQVQVEESSKKRTLLIDASPLIYRAFHGVPALDKGTPLNAVYGFLRTLLKLMRENKFDNLAVCMDGASSFRKEMEPKYKAHRKETPDALKSQFPIVEEALKAFGIFCPRITGYEADDLLATYAKMAVENGNEVLIVSPDKDVLQLVRPDVLVTSASSIPSASAKIGVNEVSKKFGVTPEQFPHLQALIGDPVDNIPKVSGLTESAAKNLIRHFGTVHNALANIDNITVMAHRDALRLHEASIKRSYELAKLRDDVPDVGEFSALSFSAIPRNSSLAFCSKYRLKSISTSLEKEWFSKVPEARGESTSTAKKISAKTVSVINEVKEPLDTQGVIKKPALRARKVTQTSTTGSVDEAPSASETAPNNTTNSTTTNNSRDPAATTNKASNGKARLRKILDASEAGPHSKSYEEYVAEEEHHYHLDALDFLSVREAKDSSTSAGPTQTPTSQASNPSATISTSISSPTPLTLDTTTTTNTDAVATSAPVDSTQAAPPPIPRARRKRSSSSSPSENVVLSTEGHVAEEVDIDTDPIVVASTRKYKERKRKDKAPTTPTSTEPVSDSASSEPTKSSQEAFDPAPTSEVPEISTVPPVEIASETTPIEPVALGSTSTTTSTRSRKIDDAVKPFLEALKKNSANPDGIEQALQQSFNPGSLSSPATRRPTIVANTASASYSTMSSNSSADLDGVLDQATTEVKPKRGRKPKMIDIDPSSIGLISASTMTSPATDTSTSNLAETSATKRKNVSNGPGSNPLTLAKAAKATTSSLTGSDDVDEDDEESNLELVDFIKSRVTEIDVEFVNLFKHCTSPVERRRVIESKLKGVTVANDLESSKRVLAKLMTLTDRFHACDSETVDLDIKKQGPVGNGRVICASIYVGPDIDFGNGPRIWIDNLDDPTTLQLFKEYFESEKILKVWHNYSFDRHVFFNHGINVNGFGGDTMHMARLWDSSRRGAKAYSLEVLSRDLLTNESSPLTSDVVAKTSMKQRFGRVKLKKDGTPSKSSVILPALDEIQRDAEWLPEWIDYATLDAEDTWRIREILESKLKAMNWKGKENMMDFYNAMWLPFGELLTDMERRGIKVDRQYLRDLVPKALEEKAAGERRFVEWAEKFVGPECRFMNPGSDAQKQQLLFAPCTNKNDPSKTMPASREFETENTEGYIEEGKKVAKKKRSFIITGLGLPFVDATDSGWPAVSHPVMTKIVGDPPEKYGSLVGMFEEKGLKGGKEACEALAAAVESSKIDTLIGTFMVPLAEFADAGSRIHCSLNINTETGRLSSRKPNLQNQPAHDKDRFGIRKAFTCEPGNNLIVADYGQLELRLLAHMTNCKSMIEAFRSGGDFHSRTALGMYPHVRQAIDEGRVLLEWDGAKGKAPLPLLKDEFGTERRRAKTLNFSIAYGKTVMGLAKDWSVSPEEARETLDRWYADRPEVKTWQEKTIARAHVTGWTRTLLGRYRPLPEINSRERTRRSHSERAAINTPLQGGAADITTRAMILLHQHKRLRQLGWYQLLQIHDELILEGPKESTEEAMSIVVNVMSNPLPEPLLVDLVVDAKSATTWYEAK